MIVQMRFYKNIYTGMHATITGVLSEQGVYRIVFFNDN